jgi:hypothetical protein
MHFKNENYNLNSLNKNHTEYQLTILGQFSYNENKWGSNRPINIHQCMDNAKIYFFFSSVDIHMRKQCNSFHMGSILSIASRDLFSKSLNITAFQPLWLPLLPDIHTHTHIKTMIQEISDVLQEATRTDILNVNTVAGYSSYRTQRTSLSNKEH